MKYEKVFLDSLESYRLIVRLQGKRFVVIRDWSLDGRRFGFLKNLDGHLVNCETHYLPRKRSRAFLNTYVVLRAL